MAARLQPTLILPRVLQHCPPQCSAQGWIALQVGILFLSSSALIAGVAMLLAITVWQPRKQPQRFSRPEARWLLVLSLWMVLGAALSGIAGAKAWLGLGNWLPFFWFFLAIRPYLGTSDARSRLAFWFCASTVPVVAVGWLQHVFGWSVELNALWGLIRWPMSEPLSGTALFDNSNVTGAWLALVMPFVALRALQRNQPPRQRALAWALALGSVASLVLSASRNAIATLLLSWPLCTSRRWRLAIGAAVVLYGLVVLWRLLGSAGAPWPAALDLVVPDGLVSKLNDMVASESTATLPYGRRETLYAYGVQWLRQHPWFGIGEQGFAALYSAELLQQFKGPPPRGLIMHAHSLPLEFALSHGLPALLMLCVAVGRNGIRAAQRWARHSLCPGDRSWCLAAVVLVWVNLWDLPLYDSRLNIAGWLILAAFNAVGSAQSEPPSGDQAKPPATA